MESKKIKPFSSLGKSFWRNHFKCFAFLHWFISTIIDFVEEKMRFPALSMAIAGNYIFGLNSYLLGIYESRSMCEPLFPHYITIPQFLLMENSFSKYSHYFYPLVFLGNLNKTPFAMSLICATYCFYDFILVLVDVILN